MSTIKYLSNLLGTIKFGRDADNLLDFTTDNQITYRVNGADSLVMKADYTITFGHTNSVIEGATSGNHLIVGGNSDLSLRTAGSTRITMDSSKCEFNVPAIPGTSDGVALGSTSKMWSDLFLASGSVVNFNNGDVTLTHSSNTLTVAGGNLAATFVGDITGDVTGNASGSSGSCTGNAATATEATNVTASANNSTNETVYPTFVDGATGTQGIETDTGLTYNPSNGNLTSTRFTGDLVGTASVATTVTITDNESTNETNPLVFVAGGDTDGGNLGLETDGDLLYNPSTATLTCDTFAGNASTATALATSRTFRTNLASTSTAGFTGAANCTPGVTGTLAVGNGGTGVTTMTALKNALDDETWTFANNITGTLATAAQTNITSLGTLTALTVDDINLNAKTLTITGDTSDTFTIVTGANGATTLTTTDGGGALGHFEVAADGNITLDAAAGVNIEMEDGEYTSFKNGTATYAHFYAESGGSTGFRLFEDGGDSSSDYCDISVTTHGATTLTTVDAAAAAAHFTLDVDGNIELNADGGTITFADAGSSLGTITSAGYSGKAATATALATARTIGGVSFDGTGNITLPGVNAEGNQNTTGNAATATALTSGNKTITGDLTVNGDTVTFSSANADDPNVIIQNTTNDAQGARLTFKKHRGVDAVDGDNIGEIEFWGYDDGTPSEQIYGKILTEIHDATSGQESGQMNFVVASHDGGQNTGLKLTGGSVDNEVDVEIGRGAASVTAVQGLLTAAGTITGSADVIAYSDEKLKENVKTLDGKKVLEMRGVSFDRIDTGKASSGVIAQEIEKVAPELVIDDGNYKGVAYGNLVGYLIEAIKDQQKQIDELKEMCNGCSK